MNDIRYSFILFPLLYAFLPFFMTGQVLLLGVLGITSIAITIVIFVFLTSIHFSVGAVTFNLGAGLNQEGTYSLFVIVIGGLFYLFTSCFGFIISLMNPIIGAMNVGIGWTGIHIPTATATQIMSVTFYDYSFGFCGIPVFLTLSVAFGIMYLLGLYFMISSRGH